MAASVGSFISRFPEFCEVDDERVQMFLDDSALLMTSEPKWLEYYNVAQEYLTAHLLTIAETTEWGDSGVVGPVVEQEVDDVRIRQAISSVDINSFDELSGTSYGIRFKKYQKICFAGIVGV